VLHRMLIFGSTDDRFAVTPVLNRWFCFTEQ